VTGTAFDDWYPTVDFVYY